MKKLDAGHRKVLEWPNEKGEATGQEVRRRKAMRGVWEKIRRLQVLGQVLLQPLRIRSKAVALLGAQAGIEKANGGKMQDTLTMTKEELQALIAEGINAYKQQNNGNGNKKRGYREPPEIKREHIDRIRAAASLTPHKAVVVLGASGWRIYTMDGYSKQLESCKEIGERNKLEGRGICAPGFHDKRNG